MLFLETLQLNQYESCALAHRASRELNFFLMLFEEGANCLILESDSMRQAVRTGLLRCNGSRDVPCELKSTAGASPPA